jgi:Na+-driven multidrug efflux pump
MLIALNKQRMFMFITAGILLFTILLDIIVIRIGFGMIGVAVCTTLMFWVASVIANFLALQSFENSVKQIWQKVGNNLFPICLFFCRLVYNCLNSYISKCFYG